MVSEADAAVCERSHVRQSYFNNRLFSVFQNDQNNISDDVQRDRSAASQVFPSHRAKSRNFLMRMVKFIR